VDRRYRSYRRHRPGSSCKDGLLNIIGSEPAGNERGLADLPALSARIGGRRLGVSLSQAGATSVPRFDYAAHLDALAGEPAAWPARTGAVSMLALDLSLPRAAPALAVLLVAWRGLRLVRQVAVLHGMRPGLLGTLGLVRRTMLAAGLVAGTEAALNAAAHAALSNPFLAHAFGEMAAAGVAARRMILLARAAFFPRLMKSSCQSTSLVKLVDPASKPLKNLPT
jgi:hypothetical protein